jgi:hypothetical protein
MTTPHIVSSVITSTLSKTALLLSNTTGIIVIILTLLWAASDVSKRFNNPTTANKQAAKSVNITPLNLPTLNAEVLSQLKMNYQPYQEQVPVKQNIDSIGMSAAEQAKQQGELTSFFIKDNKVELKAIITLTALTALTELKAQPAEQRSITINKKNITKLQALFLITNNTSGVKKIEKYHHGQAVHGYQLSISNNTEVVLTKALAQKKQKIILTMYTRR